MLVAKLEKKIKKGGIRCKKLLFCVLPFDTYSISTCNVFFYIAAPTKSSVIIHIFYLNNFIVIHQRHCQDLIESRKIHLSTGSPPPTSEYKTPR